MFEVPDPRVSPVNGSYIFSATSDEMGSMLELRYSVLILECLYQIHGWGAGRNTILKPYACHQDGP
jgi:hypothetical protein